MSTPAWGAIPVGCYLPEGMRLAQYLSNVILDGVCKDECEDGQGHRQQFALFQHRATFPRTLRSVQSWTHFSHCPSHRLTCNFRLRFRSPVTGVARLSSMRVAAPSSPTRRPSSSEMERCPKTSNQPPTFSTVKGETGVCIQLFSSFNAWREECWRYRTAYRSGLATRVRVSLCKS